MRVGGGPHSPGLGIGVRGSALAAQPLRKRKGVGAAARSGRPPARLLSGAGSAVPWRGVAWPAPHPSLRPPRTSPHLGPGSRLQAHATPLAGRPPRGLTGLAAWAGRRPRCWPGQQGPAAPRAPAWPAPSAAPREAPPGRSQRPWHRAAPRGARGRAQINKAALQGARRAPPSSLPSPSSPRSSARAPRPMRAGARAGANRGCPGDRAAPAAPGTRAPRPAWARAPRPAPAPGRGPARTTTSRARGRTRAGPEGGRSPCPPHPPHLPGPTAT